MKSNKIVISVLSFLISVFPIAFVNAEDKMEDVIEIIDVNNDKVIDYQEYVTFLKALAKKTGQIIALTNSCSVTCSDGTSESKTCPDQETCACYCRAGWGATCDQCR